MTKKKTILTSVFAFCLAVPAMLIFTACGHNHSAVAEWSSDETYHWHTCEGCEEILDKAEHTYGSWTVRTPADCDTDGLEFRVCECGKEETRAILATGHSSSDKYTYDETYHWHTCEDCEEQLDKAEHTWDEGTITTEATFQNDGVKTYTCTVCQKTRTETIAMEYIDVNYTESDAEVQTKVRFTVSESGTYYFRYEVKDCGFANGYYWFNMNKVGGGLQQTDTTHSQAKIYDANKQLIKTGMYTRAAGQFGAVETSSDTPEIVRKLLENGVKYLEMPFVTPGEYEMIVTHYPSNLYQTLEYSEGTFSKTNVALWNNSYNYFKLTLTDEMLHGDIDYGQDLQLNASPATGLTWQFLDANGNPVEKQEGDSDTYYTAPAAGTYYIVIYTETKQTGVTVQASLV